MIRTRHLLGLAVALAVVATLVLGAGSAAGTTSRLSLATRAEVNHYLTSLGIDPRGVVVQRGERNYAGPSCPGHGWTCTTATRVLQLGATNQYVCTSSSGPGSGTGTPTNQTCTISQPGGTNNTATCTEYETVNVGTQDCNITQGGTGTNNATVTQSITGAGGSQQEAIQTVEVMQSNATVKNMLKITQSINQSTAALDSSTSQMQDDFQSITGPPNVSCLLELGCASQTASGNGVNSANEQQTQIQHAQDGLKQEQNAAALADLPLTPPADCDLEKLPSQPNICAYVTQGPNAGNNSNYLAQSASEDEHSKFATMQTQGMPGDVGGLDGFVHLESTSGKSNANGHQHKTQAMQGPPTSSQDQEDPLGCCGISAFGNSQTTDTVDQSSTQNASNPGANQQLDIFGTGDSNGSCTISQKGSDNSDSSSGNFTFSPCPEQNINTSCTNGEGCSTGPPDGEGSGLVRRLFLAVRR